MKYALLIYADEKARASVPHDEQHAIHEEYDKFANELVERGVMRGGDQLADSPASNDRPRARGSQQLVTGRSVRRRREGAARRLLPGRGRRPRHRRSNSPARSPGARHGSVEVRPIIEG